MVALAEKICTQCDGSGEECAPFDGDPQFNVAGLHMSIIRNAWVGPCRKCKSRGFIRLKSLPPLIRPSPPK